MECLPVIDNWPNNHDRQEARKKKWRKNAHLVLTPIERERDLYEKWLFWVFLFPFISAMVNSVYKNACLKVKNNKQQNWIHNYSIF